MNTLKSVTKMKQWHIIVLIVVLSGRCKAIISNGLIQGDVYEDESYLIDKTRDITNKNYSDVKLSHDNLLKVEKCESDDTNCQRVKTQAIKYQLCPEKYEFFKEKCIECDCGEAPCQLDDDGKKKKCVCLKNQTLSNGKCVECDCGEMSRLCYFDFRGGKQCVCLTGAAQLWGTCTACSCGENARSCLFNEKGGLVCYCKMGYAQKNDTCYESCKRDKDCLNGGTCKKDDSASFCKCPSE